MKKIGSFLLAEMLVMTSVIGMPVISIGSNFVTVYADEVIETGMCGLNATYTLDDEGTLIISGTGDVGMCTGFEGFHDRKDIRKVVIEYGISSIGYDAFVGCSNMTNIEISSSVTCIGECAFQGCSSLANIEIPTSVSDIRSLAFWGCSSLTSIKIPSSVKSISSDVFLCKNLESIEVDNNNENYSSKDGVLFDKNKTMLLCYPCGKSSNIYIIPDSVTKIGDNAFWGCDSLKNIEIPASLEEGVTMEYLGRISSLESIEVDNNNENYLSENGVVFDKNKTMLIYYPCNKSNNIYTIPDSVTSIESFAFKDCSSLINIKIPNTVTNIGAYAFSGCNCTIYGYPDTEAEKYAKENGLEFIPLFNLISVDGISVGTSSDILSEKAVLVTETIDAESEDYKKTGEKLSEYLSKALEKENLNIKYFAYEIHVTDEENNIIQPEDKVTVNIPVPNGYTEENIKVYRVEEDDSFTDMNAIISDKNLVFETDHFSIYVIASVNKDDAADTSVIKGDLNGDGNVDIKDSALLKRNLAGWDVEINTSVADLNGDGNVDIKDSALLKRNLAGWDVKFAE